MCVPNRISKPHTTEHATTLRARASGSNGPLLYNTNCREAAPRRVLPCRPPGGPAPPLISIIIDPGARSRIGLETYVLRGIRMVPRWFRDGSGAATVGRPYVLRGIRMVPRWFHDGSARVPRWFRSRHRRRTIRFAGDPGGSAMVPRWFRTGSLPNARVAATLAAHAAAAALPFPRQPTPSSLGGFLRTDFHPKIFYAARIFQKQYQV